MGETYKWYASQEDGTWKLKGQIGGENNEPKDKFYTDDIINKISLYDKYQDSVKKTFNDTVDEMWKSDKLDYRLVRSDNEIIKERIYADENINETDPGGKGKVDDPDKCDAGFHWDETTKTCIKDAPPEFDWTPYLPWIYAAVGIAVAGVVIYLVFFGQSPLINQVQKKVV